MKAITFLTFVIIFASGCSNPELHIPEGAILVAKYIVLDEDLSPIHHKCAEEVKPFDEMGTYDCSFTLEDYEFDIEDKFVLDGNGRLLAFWNYLSEGPVIHKKEDFESDQKYYEFIGGPDLLVKMSDDGKQIIDTGNTLTIERIFPKQKLLLMQRKPGYEREGRRVIFEYR